MPPLTRKRKLEQAVEESEVLVPAVKKQKITQLPTPKHPTAVNNQARLKRVPRTRKILESSAALRKGKVSVPQKEIDTGEQEEEDVIIHDQPSIPAIHPHPPLASLARRANSEPLPQQRPSVRTDRVEDWVDTQLTAHSLADHDKWQNALDDMAKALDYFHKRSATAPSTENTPNSSKPSKPSKRKLSYPQATVQLDDLGIHNDRRLDKPVALQVLCDKVVHIPSGTNKDGHSSNNCPASRTAVEKQRHAVKSLEYRAIELLEDHLGYKDEKMDMVQGEKGIARERNLLWHKDSVPVPEAETPKLQTQLQLSGIPSTP